MNHQFFLPRPRSLILCLLLGSFMAVGGMQTMPAAEAPVPAPDNTEQAAPAESSSKASTLWKTTGLYSFIKGIGDLFSGSGEGTEGGGQEKETNGLANLFTILVGLLLIYLGIAKGFLVEQQLEVIRANLRRYLFTVERLIVPLRFHSDAVGLETRLRSRSHCCQQAFR